MNLITLIFVRQRAPLGHVISREREICESLNSVLVSNGFTFLTNVYLAFKLLRCLLLNTLSLMYCKGYNEMSSKLSMLGSRARGQKKSEPPLKTSAATINLDGVRARETCRIPRPFLVVSANGDSTRTVSEKSEYSDINNFCILVCSISRFFVRCLEPLSLRAAHIKPNFYPRM